MKEMTDAYREFLESWTDFNAKMMKSSLDTIKECYNPESYEKFYHSWSENMSEMTEKMMRTPGFTEKSWEAFKSMTGFQKLSQMATQQYLKNMNIPTREEYDELSERISYLDDKIEELENRLRESQMQPVSGN